MTTKTASKKNEKILRYLHPRSLEPVAQCLMNHLLIPDVYVDVSWGGGKVDVLAVDRAGTGALHIAEVKIGKAELRSTLEQLRKVPAHYRWIAYFPDNPREMNPQAIPKKLFEAVPARIGLIQLFLMAYDEIGARLLVRAERSMEIIDPKSIGDFKRHNRPIFKVE